MFLKVHVKIIIRVSESNVLGQIYIDVINFGGGRGVLYDLSYISHLLFIKTKK